MPSTPLVSRAPVALVNKERAQSSTVMKMAGAAADKDEFDLGLLVYFGLWYLGNYYYNITNKLALKVTSRVNSKSVTFSPDKHVDIYAYK